jgi:hypothetical protein
MLTMRRAIFMRSNAASGPSGSRRIFRRAAGCTILAALAAVHMAAGTIQYKVTPLGTNGVGESIYQYSYFLSGFDFRDAGGVEDEFDITFDPSIFDQLSNGVAPAGFDLLLFQPNVPIGAPGDYNALVTVDQPSLNGTFSVTAALKNTATLPTGTALDQTFTIDEFDTSGAHPVASPATGPALILSTPGVTSPLVVTGIPEPASFELFEAGMFFGCLFVIFRQRSPFPNGARRQQKL